MLKRGLKNSLRAGADALASLLYGGGAGSSTSSAQEAANTAELRASVRALDPLVERQPGHTEGPWVENLRRLRELFNEGDPSRFLRWDVVQRTMFLTNTATALREWQSLRASPNWPRWDAALYENSTGRPIRFLLRGRTSGNQIHHTYHISQFEERSPGRIDRMRLIFEFGGGYGSMCRQAHRLGFTGKYLIFDLPEFSLLQRYFLRSIGLNLLTADEWAQPGRPGILLLSDLSELERTLPAVLPHQAPSMFIATWSLSEVPIELRTRIMALLTSVDAVLIAYQHRFGSMDNVQFFGNWSAALPTMNWQHAPIPGMGENSYLIGARSK